MLKTITPIDNTIYVDDEVNLPLMFIQKLRINQAVDIFNDVLNHNIGE